MTGPTVGLLFGVGLFLVWWSCWVPEPGREQTGRRAGPLDRLRDELVQAGFAGVSVRTLAAAGIIAFLAVIAVVVAAVVVLSVFRFPRGLAGGLMKAGVAVATVVGMSHFE